MFLALAITAPCGAANQTARFEGLIERQVFRTNGDVHFQQDFEFNLWLSSPSWILELKDLSDKEPPVPGGRPHQTWCDGTNLYSFSPETKGVLTLPAKKPFHGSATVDPGIVKNFPGITGPVWWLFCSASVLSAPSGPSVDFLHFGGLRSAAPVFYIKDASGAAPAYFSHTRVFLADPKSAATPPIGELTITETVATNGWEIPLKAVAARYRQLPVRRGGPQSLLEQYVITTRSFSRLNQAALVFPNLSPNTMINDLRAHRERLSYVDANFLPP